MKAKDETSTEIPHNMLDLDRRLVFQSDSGGSGRGSEDPLKPTGCSPLWLVPSPGKPGACLQRARLHELPVTLWRVGP